MPLLPTTSFTVRKLIPYFPERAMKTTIRLAPSKVFTRGQLLALVAAANAVHTVTGNTNVTGGTYTITVLGQTTAALAHSAAAATVQAALQALPAIGSGGVIVTGGALNTATPFVFTFSGGSLANYPVPLLTLNSASLVGSGVATITTVLTTAGQTNATYDAYNSTVVAVPSTAIVPSAVAGGTITDGVYRVFYTGRNALGETTLSAQTGTVTLTGGSNTIRIAAMTGLPAGFTNLDIYIAGLTGNAGAPTYIGTIPVTTTTTAQQDFTAPITNGTTIKYPPLVNTAYASTANTAALVLEYDVRTDALGQVSFSTTNVVGEQGESYETASAFYRGDFRATELIGFDAKAVLDLHARAFSGNTTTGVITL
jgi:hypothetical protein